MHSPLGSIIGAACTPLLDSSLGCLALPTDANPLSLLVHSSSLITPLCVGFVLLMSL
ncbi:hypothetical protein SynROS8604_01309 [Synechococcus sp. ROS8604]|nr:hypothetical protein SynROS8604_01309 [Synechococcus sp. ROS8604]